MRPHLASLIAGIALSALGLHGALRVTETSVRTPTHRALTPAQRNLDVKYGEAIDKAARNVERARKRVAENDFPSHFKWAVAYSVLLRCRNLKESDGMVGQTAPDEEFLRILDLCRECASNPREEAMLSRFESGRVWTSADAGN